MKFDRLVAAFGALLLSTGCVSAPSDLKFDSQSNNAMLVLSAAPSDTLQMYAFRAVDLATGKFKGQAVEIGIDNLVQYFMWDGVPNQINHEDKRRAVTLVVQQLPPGDYALVELISVKDEGARMMERTWLCMFEGGPVYGIGGGQTSIIRVDTAFSRGYGPRDSSVMQEYAKANAKYPGLQKNAQIVTPKAMLKWTKTEPGWFHSRNCAEPETFTIVAQRAEDVVATAPAPAVQREQKTGN